MKNVDRRALRFAKSMSLALGAPKILLAAIASTWALAVIKTPRIQVRWQGDTIRHKNYPAALA